MGNLGPSFPMSLRGVISSHSCVFGGIIINYLFTPYSTRGRASAASRNWIFYKIVILKKMSEVKKILNVIVVDYIIFPGKLYFSFFE
jgi:hypothetical protein